MVIDVLTSPNSEAPPDRARSTPASSLPARGLAELTEVARDSVAAQRMERDRAERRTRRLQVIIGGLGLVAVALHGVSPIEEHRELASFLGGIGEAFLIAALVSFAYDIAYHKTQFVKPIAEIQDSARVLDDEVQRLVTRVDSINNVLGYSEFRRHVLAHYGSASRRILSVSDYWPIDPEWWSADDRHRAWDEAQLYKNLRASLIRTLDAGHGDRAADGRFVEAFPLHVTFAGRVPKPAWGSDAAALTGEDLGRFIARGGFRLAPDDFRRFLGVAWRTVIAHRLRKEWRRECVDRFLDKRPLAARLQQRLEELTAAAARERAGQQVPHDRAVRDIVDSFYVPVRAVVAVIPVGATIVDDDVFLHFASSTSELDIRDSRGTLLELPSALKQHTADAYVALISRYLPQAHSAREYIRSMLFLTNLMAERNLDRERLDSVSDSNETYLSRSLGQLGLHEWCRDEAKKFTGRITDVDRETRLRNGAMEIMQEFLRMPGIHGVPAGEPQSAAAESIRYADLRRALA